MKGLSSSRFNFEQLQFSVELVHYLVAGSGGIMAAVTIVGFVVGYESLCHDGLGC